MFCHDSCYGGHVTGIAPRPSGKDIKRLKLFSNRHLAQAILLLAVTFSPPAIHAGVEKQRTISFYHIHTKETLTVTYRRNGRYLPKALKSINWLMRDWRQDTEIKIDPRTIDILWEMHTELGSKQPIHIICGYRSRKTNNMLRRTRGGQARNSLHISGKAIDAAFPDVPVRNVRYSALIRELGGVGYYPTSAIPFIHVDTGRVRHWPRINRDELALLFPNGKSKHVPRGGRHITPRDVKRAKSRRKDLAIRMAAYHKLRTQPKTPMLLADSGLIIPPKPIRVARPISRSKPSRVLAQVPQPEPSTKPWPTTAPWPPTTPWTVEIEPNKRVALASPLRPTPMRAPTTFLPRPSETDRARLNRLIAEATFVPLVEPPRLLRIALHDQAPASRLPSHTKLQKQPNLQLNSDAAAETSPQSNDTLTPTKGSGMSPRSTAPKENTDRFNWAPDLIAVLDDRVWARAPEYDDDHPDELAYRPFPIEPLMTSTLNDPIFAQMTKLDNAKTLDLLDQASAIPPMQLRPPQQVAQLMWRQEFSGAAVEIHSYKTQKTETDGSTDRIGTRSVTTSRQ